MRLHQQGLTLIELLVAMIVAVVLLTVAVPSFQQIAANNALKSTSRDLIAALNTARIQAVNVREDVSVEPEAGGWADGWILASSASAIEEQVEAFTPHSNVSVQRQGAAGAITFFARGGVANGGATFLVCHNDLTDGRKVTVSFLGKIQSEIEACE
ncbi:GspH/FimT family pseudopilin [Nitrincola sp.]|uniref:GspH/FimT family pseudopilin n=1 Tax=Nitrincola sp. TaxID=1926584 RepID=UPI003A92267A